MGLKVALNHKTLYSYDRAVRLGPQIIRLRPAPHSRTRILSYSLKVAPKGHFLNWIQDPYGNFLARVLFPDPVRHFDIEVDLVADMEIFNPFDFFLDPEAETFPFSLPKSLKEDLAPYMASEQHGSLFRDYVATIDRTPMRTIDFLVAVNRKVQSDVAYRIRMEPNTQSPDETLRIASGSCRDSALLLVEMLRACGLAARFTSGYLIQLVPDRTPLVGNKGVEKDFTDLHAWAEAYVPGAGWVGLDPTSGLLTGEGHIPLSTGPKPGSAAPVEGVLEPAEVEFRHEMSVRRLDESPRPFKPFPEGKNERLDIAGRIVDARLASLGVTLTSGAEPTFVSDGDRAGAEWGPDAIGPTKKGLSQDLMQRLRARWSTGGLIHSSQGKWYPGESLPRWALSCYWRRDGRPLWKDSSLLADERIAYGFETDTAKKFIETLCDLLGVPRKFIHTAYEDPLYFLQKERDLPPNVTPEDSKLRDPEERLRLERALSRGLDVPTGFVLPLQKGSWKSGPWPTRNGFLVLSPGDSPLGLRLPLPSLPWASEQDSHAWYPDDPSADESREKSAPWNISPLKVHEAEAPQTITEQRTPDEHPPLVPGESAAWVVRTALCVQVREGVLYVFFPPTRSADDWFELAAMVEKAAAKLGTPLVLEGYHPPYSPEIASFQITPDPGVIEVNVPPGASWNEWTGILRDLYDSAAQAGLSTEKYLVGGQVVGTGGGCHLILGGPRPAASPFLTRPDLLRSWVAYMNRHPSLSYAFAGLFIGASSQAPRPDETNLEAVDDLEITFAELDRMKENPSPWLTDRLFRNILADSTGNTHRSEICIDKLYSPDHAAGRRGLVEFRCFEMAPHVDIALSESLLLRALSLHFLENPYRGELARWGTALRDKWMLPHYLWTDFSEILADLEKAGIYLPREPFEAHWEFRFPLIGGLSYEGMELEFRVALEPWPVLGEEPGGGGTVRYVDSSVDRLQVKTKNWDARRFALVCRGLQVPLRATDDEGVYVAGVRFKAWKLPSGLHPTIPADGELVFDIYDRYSSRVVGGCTYYVAHPAGRNYDEPPINAYEAEARRAARFFPGGYSPAQSTQPIIVDSREFPHTIDLRRGY